MRRPAIITLVVLPLVALVVSQPLIPGIGENRIEDRLTEGGGSAEVSLSAFPALRLLFDDGDRLDVTARDLELELEGEADVLDRLDGFEAVDVSITDSSAGPIELETFALTRVGDGDYLLVCSGRASPQGLAATGLDTLGLPGGELADAFLDQVLGEDGARDLPLELDMELASDDGRLQVVSGGGTVAGFDTGPLAGLITSAIVARL